VTTALGALNLDRCMRVVGRVVEAHRGVSTGRPQGTMAAAEWVRVKRKRPSARRPPPLIEVAILLRIFGRTERTHRRALAAGCQ